ncbi:MAG: cytochrome b/b6 domain-containing protein [Candidatus Methanoperedens sp.]|nr:cytochrome b/b6 domain-containing protein [Candidatus Methanoperedens sp.]MCZ7359332.1 cytochrome b/b6 domain-containing protein [Candidatus Methanoperedens sp.]HLB69997.1 cytochrome b/b6 domain-containing protein [Candidatus Methanoperedens sp.]
MKILRFDIFARLLHWSHAVIFIWLLITGIQLFFTPKSLLGDPFIRMIHLYASVPFILFPIMIYITGRPSTRKDIKDLISWTDLDLRWFRDFFKKKKAVVIDKFNGGQKVNFMAALISITGLSFSGFVVWMKSMFSVDFVELNFMIHDFFAVFSFLLLFSHIVFSLYYSESLRGIIFGMVDEEWANEHYPAWSGKKK